MSRHSSPTSELYTPCAQYDTLLLLRGGGTFNGLPFRESLAALLPPRSPFRLQGCPAGEALLLSFAPAPPGLPDGAVLAPDVPGALADYFTAAFRLLEQAPVPDGAAEAAVRALALWIARAGAEPALEHLGRSHARQLVEEARQIVGREYTGELTLQAVAGRLFVNPCYLSTIFREITGSTFRGYLKNVRLQHARQLLEDTNYLITDVAMQSGFNSAAYLISSFRQAYGVTPTAYRSQRPGAYGPRG